MGAEVSHQLVRTANLTYCIVTLVQRPLYFHVMQINVIVLFIAGIHNARRFMGGLLQIDRHCANRIIHGGFIWYECIETIHMCSILIMPL
jgi:hypothetical protein